MTENASTQSTSVVIVTYHTGAALWVCLFRLLQLKGVHEIIVVNNGNETEVELHLKKLEQKHAALKLLTGHGNVGFATGCNLGAQQATGDYVLLLNPDAVPMEKDALQQMTALFTNPQIQPPAAMIGGVLRNEDGSEQRASRRNLMTPQNALLEGLGLQNLSFIKLPRLNIEHTPLPAEPTPVPAITGACMLMERERYVQMRGLDENYFLHVEDMDLCRRIHAAGGSIWIQPQVNILHYGHTSKVSALFVERMKTKGFYRYFRLHFYRKYFWRYLMNTAATLRLGVRVAGSFFENSNARPRLHDAEGLRRVQAIVRGVGGAMEALRHKQPAPIPAGSTVLVTGASTAIGLFAIGRLLAYGCKVIALKHRKMIGFFHPNLTWIEGDLTNMDGLQSALSGKQCDYAIHCAGIWHTPGLSYILKQMNVRHIVAFSSTSLLSKQHSSSPAEQEMAERLAAGEAALTNEAGTWGLGYTIIRPTMIYGAGVDENITRIARTIDAKHRFVLMKDARGQRAPVHADDLAIAALNALENPAANGKIYTLQGGTVLTYQAMVAKVFRTMGLPPKLVFVPALDKLCGLLHRFSSRVPHPAVALRMQDDLVFPDDGAMTELGVTPRPFLEDGMVDLGLCEEEICRSLLPA